MHLRKEAIDVSRCMNEFRQYYSDVSELNPSALIVVKYPLGNISYTMFSHFAQSVVRS